MNLGGWILISLLPLPPAAFSSDGGCIYWAQTFEAFEQVKPEHREPIYTNMLRQLEKRHEDTSTLVKAYNWVNQGLTSRGAYSACPSY